MTEDTSPVLALCVNPAIDLYGTAAHIHAIRKIRVGDERIDPGGGGINVARVLTAFGKAVNLLYLSGGDTGRLLDDMLAALPIARQRVEIAGRTRISYSVHERDSDSDYRFVPEGPCVSDAETGAFFDVLDRATLPSDALVVGSGSLPGNMPVDTYAQIAARLAARRVRYILDTSGAALEAALSAGATPPFLIKPSIGELERLVGSDLDERTAGEAAMALIASGRVQHVALTMGAHGAILATGDRLYRQPGIRVQGRSAVGAGDSFVGGFVYRLSAGDPLPDAFRYAVAAGTAAVMTPGSMLCRPADVESIHERMPATL